MRKITASLLARYKGNPPVTDSVFCSVNALETSLYWSRSTFILRLIIRDYRDEKWLKVAFQLERLCIRTKLSNVSHDEPHHNASLPQHYHIDVDQQPLIEKIVSNANHKPKRVSSCNDYWRAFCFLRGKAPQILCVNTRTFFCVEHFWRYGYKASLSMIIVVLHGVDIYCKSILGVESRRSTLKVLYGC